MTAADRARHEDRCLGSILGLAIGDALGYPHEFRRVEQVRRELGRAASPTSCACRTRASHGLSSPVPITRLME